MKNLKTNWILIGILASLGITIIGCDRDETITSPPDQTPTLEFRAVASVSPTVGTRPLRVSCNGSATGGFGTSTLAWDFGEGIEASGGSAIHTFDAIGTHFVSLTVADETGQTATKVINITVKGNVPKARITTGSLAGFAPHTVQFDGSSSTDPDNDIVSFRWDFGDGATAEGRSQSHTYSISGAYRVRLTVTDDEGLSSTAQVTANISTFKAGPFFATVRATTSGSVSVSIPSVAGGLWLITATGSAAYDATGGDAFWHGPDGAEGRGIRRGCTIGSLGATYQGASICIGSGSQLQLAGGSTISFWFADDQFHDNAGSYQVKLEWISR